MFVQLLIMSGLLGVSSFACGMLPLAFVFSKNHLDRLSAIGTGLLLGAALGVIIPEGVERTVEAHPNAELPTSRIALALLAGFTFMLVIEQLVTPHSHSHSHSNISPQTKRPVLQHQHSSRSVEFDAELGDFEGDQSSRSAFHMVELPDTPSSLEVGSGRERAFPLTLGLVIHSLADGLALGVSALAKTEPGATNTVSLVVFLALMLHKAPTSLALTTSLLGSSLPRSDCKKYLAIFSASTPVSAILSYLLLSVYGNTDGSDWTGLALLLSGGTFLYVATVLQPVSHSSSGPGEMPSVFRVLLITAGMFIPFILSAVLGHGH